MSCPVPGVIKHGRTRITIRRVWPTTGGRLRFEGSDDRGRVRAGSTTLGATPKVRLLAHGEDRKLPDLSTAMVGGELIVHRAGKRAVVRQDDRYVKVVRPGDAAALADAAEAGRRRAVQAGMLAPEVIEASSGQLVTSTVPGVALHSAARTATARQWWTWWAQWADRWPHLASAGNQGLERFTAADEVAVLNAAIDRALDWGALPDPTGRGREHVAEVSRAVRQVTAPQLAVVHRDLHDKQLLAGPDGIGVLDFDTACVAEPALDLANLAVHARWRATQGVWTHEQAKVACSAVAQARRTLAVPEDRCVAYAHGTSLRLAALYAFRPRWSAVAISWWEQQMRELS